ncbi:MAG: transposase [Pyramidobacter sp.]|nr:transposase [Pyramidobacter sp.]
MTDYKTLVKAYRAWLIAAAAVLLAALTAWWYARGFGGNADVGKTIDAIKTNTQTNERRVDAIIDAAKHKEEEARNETNEQMAVVSDDALPDLLTGLLRDYRAKR